VKKIKNNRAKDPVLPVFPEVSWGLAIDLYQLTMAQGYFVTGMEGRQAIFHMFYRHPPFGGRYVVTAGIGPFVDWLEALRFTAEDLAFLGSVNGKDGQPLFDESFLEFLANWRFRGSIEAVPEGTIVFPHQPIVRVRAPILDAQIIETTLLTIVNHQSLIATKASRIRQVAGTDEVLEFGLRRAHGLDGGLSASRAAHIGGADATSNVLAAARYGIPLRGTHGHSWVMAFDSETEAFKAYADIFPNNSVLLVDTYDTPEGVRKAIEVGHRLREKGADLMGIRLDSGDLAYLSIEARRLLDASGFEDTRIVASNDLDERLIASLKAQGAPIDIWGVGTKLITAFDEPALGGVYKLAAIENSEGEMVERMKLSEQPAKTSIPGCLEVARLWLGERCVGDVMYDSLTEPQPGQGEKVITIISAEDSWKRKVISTKNIKIKQLLRPVFIDGVRTGASEPLQKLRERTTQNMASFDPAIFRFDNPHAYAAGLSQALFERREMMRVDEFEKTKVRLSSVHNNGTGGSKPNGLEEKP
jgi:nicotinate phosphoribosyltransferase